MLRVEVRDLRVVLQSSDKELETTRTELQQQRAEHERETTQLSNSLISTQLQLDTVKYKHTVHIKYTASLKFEHTSALFTIVLKIVYIIEGIQGIMH